MDFGKLDNISRVDFRLPGDQRRSSQILAAGKRPELAKAYVGCPQWTQKEWVGRVYPKGTGAKDFLTEYGRQFNTIELNTTHYRIPDEATVRRWKSVVPPHFKFCPKFPQEISHDRRLVDTEPQTRAFCHAIGLLEGNLGTSFIQLSPTFSPAELPSLARYLDTLPDGFSVAVEFRHPAWFIRGELIHKAQDALAARDVATVITDVAGRRDVSHATLTAPRVLVRLVGNALHPSDYERCNTWSERLGRWVNLGLREFYIFAHEPDNALSPDLASEMIARLKQYTNCEISDWVRHNQNNLSENHQMSLFETGDTYS